MLSRSVVEAPEVRSGGGRLVGVDVARALAFGGMLLAHFAISRGPDPSWLRALDAVADGRAAPLFCVLLGVGAGLLLGRGRSGAVLARRAAALFALGLLVWPFVPQVYVILPHYGVLLAVVPLLRRLPRRALLPVAGAAFTVPSLVVAAVAADPGLREGRQPRSHAELLDVPEIVEHLAWSGGYPLVGWVGFVLVGLWLARLPLRSQAVRLRLLVVGSAVTALRPLVASAERTSVDRLASAVLESAAHSNQLAWYVLASASSVAVIGGCLLLGGRAPGVVRPLQSLGRLALSAYLLHLGIGVWLVWGWHERAPTLAAQVLVASSVFVVLTAIAHWWTARRAHGPLEALLRAVAR